MQKKLCQLGFTAVLVVVVFLFNAQTNQANAAVLKLPTVSVETVSFAATERDLNPWYPKYVGVGSPAKILFKRTQVSNSNDSLGLNVFFSITGSASPEDYVGLSERKVYFPPNVYEVEVLVNAVNDDIFEAIGETVFFNLLTDENARSPHYQLGQKTVAKTLIAESMYNPVALLTANDQEEVFINAGDRVSFELLTAFGACTIYGGEFGDIGSQIPYHRPILHTWVSSPTQTVEYTVRCLGYMATPAVDTVRVNVIQ